MIQKTGTTSQEDVARALSRRAGGLILAKRTTTTALPTSSATGAAAEAGKLAVGAAAAAQVRDIIDWAAGREAFTRATTRAMWERNPDYGIYVAAVCYDQGYGLSDPAAVREGVVSVSLVSGVLDADYDCLYLGRGESSYTYGEGGYVNLGYTHSAACRYQADSGDLWC